MFIFLNRSSSFIFLGFAKKTEKQRSSRAIEHKSVRSARISNILPNSKIQVQKSKIGRIE